MIGFDEACRRLTELALPVGTEPVALDQAWNRVLAAPVTAPRSAPSAAVSAMDGYAVRDSDILAGLNRLQVVGQAFAGPSGHDRALEPGTCVRTFTGARLPPGADRVVIQEQVRPDAGDACFEGALGEARHVRAAGSDFRAGEVLLEAGTLLTPQALVAAAAADRAVLEVFRRPRVVILSTGDELVAPGHAADRPEATPESVSYGVAALARAWGGDLIARSRLGDDLPALQRAASLALDTADLVVTTGGASVGEHDFALAMFAPFGLKPAFQKVAIKPGKPVWLGRVGERLVLGLPGNPSAAMVTARLFLAPLLAGLNGRRPDVALAWETAQLASTLPAACGRESFLRARSDARGVHLLGNQDSSVQGELARADLLIRRAPDAPAESAGGRVEVLRF